MNRFPRFRCILSDEREQDSILPLTSLRGVGTIVARIIVSTFPLAVSSTSVYRPLVSVGARSLGSLLNAAEPSIVSRAVSSPPHRFLLSSTLHLHRLLSLALIGRRHSHSSEAIEVRLSLLFHWDNRTNRIPAPGKRHTAVIASHLVKRLLQGESGDPPSLISSRL